MSIPDSELIAAFRAQGFLRIEAILDADEREALRRIYHRAFETMDDARRRLAGTADGRDLLPQVLSPHRRFPELVRFRFHARLDAWAKALLGPDAAFSHDHMIRKPAGYGAVTPLHQDQAYHRPTHRYRNVNFWMPLDDAGPEDGCLRFVPGSHLGTVVPHERIPDADGLSALDQPYWEANCVIVPCPAGSVTAHHSYMLHGAGANRGGRDRNAYITIWTCPPQPLERPLVFTWGEARHG